MFYCYRFLLNTRVQNSTSPVKLGEYLASGTPIVASDISALRDWLTDDDVHFVLPDDGSDLAQGILKVLNNRVYAQRLGKEGLQKAKTFVISKSGKDYFG